MRVFEKIADIRGHLKVSRDRRSIGLVPTMGNLHEGHLRLVDACREEMDVTVVSVFVNPSQFGPNEDFESYPRTLAEDLALLEAHAVDAVFHPAVEEMYPDARSQATVSLPSFADTLCGASRPGHFDGVATVVAKLFHIVAPDAAFFGEKDWQQLTLIRAMTRALDMPVHVLGVPTVRDEQGLALSSRNRYLTAEEAERAPQLFATLVRTAEALAERTADYAALEAAAGQALADAGFDVDYVAIRDPDRPAERPTGRAARIFGAARLGGARLIDNVAATLAPDRSRTQ